MAQIGPQEGISPSLLDRLIDPESEGTGWRRGYSVDQAIDAVRRDIEDLLNSHLTAVDIPEELVEVRRSIVAFGMPDLPSIKTPDRDGAREICAAIEQAIATFEPRLADVRATLIDPKGIKSLRMNVEIQGTLRMDPAPEVAFVTLLKLTTGEATIEQADR